MIRSTIPWETLANAGCKSICVKVVSAGRQMLLRQRGSGGDNSSHLLIRVVKKHKQNALYIDAHFNLVLTKETRNYFNAIILTALQ